MVKFMAKFLSLGLALWVVAACASAVVTPTPEPSPTPAPSSYPLYVLGGQAGPEVRWLVVGPCSHAPRGWADAAAACDFDSLQALRVDFATYAAKEQGDPYP